MENPDLQPDSTEAQFFADLQSGKPGAYTLNRALREEERKLIPSPSAISFFDGYTHVQIFVTADECRKFLDHPAGISSKKFIDGLVSVVLHSRGKISFFTSADSRC
jgi:hypothetical protein